MCNAILLAHGSCMAPANFSALLNYNQCKQQYDCGLSVNASSMSEMSFLTDGCPTRVFHNQARIMHGLQRRSI